MMATNQTVLITGATSGIGEALFHQYVDRGSQVIGCGRNQEVLSAMAGKAFKTLSFDVNNHGDIEQAASEVEQLDILILNAGSCRYIDDAQNFDGQLFEEVIATNLLSLGHMLQHFLPKVRKGGQVVFISSSATIVPFPRAEAYGASKAGVDYLANSLRLDLNAKGIDVTLVHPGFIKTPLTDKNDFPMPFMLSSEQAAQRIYKGVSARKSYLHFPFRLTFLLKLFAWLPAPIWRSMMLKDIKS